MSAFFPNQLASTPFRIVPQADSLAWCGASKTPQRLHSATRDVSRSVDLLFAFFGEIPT
jgi:hypothetical protein